MSNSKSESPDCCYTVSPSSIASTELKLYQAFIFSVPIFFTFVLLFLFYLFYLRRRRVDWASLRMRANLRDSNDIFRAELGLKKELREMLPIIVYKESFSVKDTQCPVCLGDYEAEDRLQQIPACGHTFHMECIDQWLANHVTCPLCRLSLIESAKVPSALPNNQAEIGQDSSAAGNTDETSVLSGPTESFGESQYFRAVHNSSEEEERRSECADVGRESGGASNEPEEHENIRRPFVESQA
ncbi:RING-H2 finger protein ATL7 isoform X2 [Manihot esculenta]|uniref:RING-type E3 ubiquitin transferase n=2 Tax=Manihot esculenta TaxID=3983 RepID=A0A251J6W7_MANES|nr:RING-H2 finger protein ATL7 isoform X2 [Manihot esculenta]KAG8633499.1 hypothetical protein MANES_18G109000v8 [Manihot esculenta]OAY23808.1 hypothetical protein MANES_18G109000v8 [Manihot esculenta]OAY23809.1 hypothetical protein MANES_18G109000v8 [Manihot esculenta]